VIKGEIFDVAVDIRRGSPSYGKWLGVTLSEDNMDMLYVPEGFAHGFCVLSDVAEVMYKTTNIYAASSEDGIIWSDQELGIEWPVKEPALLKKDNNWPTLREADVVFY